MSVSIVVKKKIADTQENEQIDRHYPIHIIETRKRPVSGSRDVKI